MFKIEMIINIIAMVALFIGLYFFLSMKDKQLRKKVAVLEERIIYLENFIQYGPSYDQRSQSVEPNPRGRSVEAGPRALNSQQQPQVPALEVCAPAPQPEVRALNEEKPQVNEESNKLPILDEPEQKPTLDIISESKHTPENIQQQV